VSQPFPVERVRPEGTRVVVMKPNAPVVAGSITAVRLEPHLKRYVVRCDDGNTVYASAHDLALETDGARTPLGPRPEY
jgi:hypothetical protein